MGIFRSRILGIVRGAGMEVWRGILTQLECREVSEMGILAGIGFGGGWVSNLGMQGLGKLIGCMGLWGLVEEGGSI
jgi:hypothetical protein